MMGLIRRVPLLGCGVALAVLASVLVLAGPPTPEAGAQSNITVQFDRSVYNAREGGSARLKLTFSQATPSQSSFVVSTVNGTAILGVDYSVAPAVVTVPAGVTSHTFGVSTLADSEIEDYETFSMNIAGGSLPTGYTLGANGTATVQIVNVSVVPDNWALKPSGVGPGEQFRLLFKTHNERDATASTISTYDTFVRNRVSGASTGHADIRQYSSTFRVVGSTPTVDAAWHTATGIMVSGEPSHTPWSTPIYWLNGPKIADDHNDFWDGTWDDNRHSAHRRANGNASTNNRGPNTGTRTGTTHATAGTKKPGKALGTSNANSRWGGGDPNQNPIDQGDIPKGNNNVYIGLSGIFEVDSGDAANPTISIAATQEKVTEGDTIRFTITSMPPPTTQKSVSVTVDETTDGGRNFVPASQRGDRTVTVPANTGTVTFTVRTENNDRSERDGGVTVTVNDGTSYDPHDTQNTASTVIQSDEEFNELSASVRLGNGSAGPAHPGAKVVFKFDTGEAATREIGGIRTQLAWSGDVISPRSDHRPTTWDQFWYHPDTGRPGGYVRTGLERTIYRNNTGFDTDVWVKSRAEAGGDVDNGWIAMRSIASGKTVPHLTAGWACMPVGSGTCPSAWPGVPAATVAPLDSSVVSGQDARFRVTVSPAPGAGETRRVYLRTWYRYLRGGGQDQNEAFRHVDVGSSGTATFAMPTRVSRVGPGRTVNVQVQEDIAYNRGGTTHARVGTTRFNPSSQPCWYGHTHYPASSPYAVRIGPIDVGTLKLLARHGAFGARNENEADFNSDNSVDALDLDRNVLPAKYHHLLDVTHHAAMGITECLTADEIDDLGAGTYRTVWTTCKVDYGHTDHTHGSYTDGRGGSHSHHHNYFPADKFGDGNCAFAGFRSDSQSDSQTDAGFPDPGVLTFSEVTATAMTLSWPERDVDHYRVYWGPAGDGANVQEVQVDADTHSYTISGLKPGTVYAVIVYSHDLNQVTTTGYQPTAAQPAVADDDDPPCDAADAIVRARAAFAWHTDNNGGSETLFWQILAYLGADSMPAPPGGIIPAPTTPEAVRTFSDGRTWPGWVPINAAMACHTPTTPPTAPEVSIAAGAGIGEGGVAVFTVTAVPAPSAALDVTVSVTQSGDFGVSPGSRTVTVPVSGSAVLTVATANDSADEADGAVTATVSAGVGYTVSATSGSASVAVSDDDDPPPPPPVVDPEVSITAGADVTEGGDAVFTITADPAPATPLTVTVSVSQSGDFGAATGSRQVTIPTTGSAVLTVATTGDTADEADGSVTATVNTGQGYTVSATAGSASVAVSDDDDPAPPPSVNATPSFSVSDASGAEGGTLTFTVTLSPSSDRYAWVHYYARPAFGTAASATFADFAQTYGMLTFEPGDTTKTITVALVDDNTPEANETFKLVLYTPAQAKITDGEATGTITDND